MDFYVEQGYADIARDTLDVLERQYGTRPEIESRRAMLDAQAVAEAAAFEADVPPEASANGDGWIESASALLTGEPTPVEAPTQFEAPLDAPPPAAV